MFFIAHYGEYGIQRGYFSRDGSHKEAVRYMQNRGLKDDTVITVGAEAARQFWLALRSHTIVEESGGRLHNQPNTSSPARGGKVIRI